MSYVGVGLFRRWSLQRQMLDIPNERSSHTIPTPRGGGIVIVSTGLIAYLILSQLNIVSFKIGFFTGGLIIALISWLDDLFSVSFIWRFVVHSIAAVLFIYTTGYFKFILIPYYGIVDLSWLGAILTYLWIVWLTNAYNFMDGIDGIAGVQAVVSGIGWILVGKNHGMANTYWLALILTSVSLGFLIHNWQPAKIFMGDVGSAFLGFCFAVIPLINNVERENAAQFYPILTVLIVWFFFFDTIYTFFRRLLKKERVWQAHREHIYQQMVINGFSHQFVTICYGLVGVLNSIIIFFLSIKNNLKPLSVLIMMIVVTVESFCLIGWLKFIKKIGKYNR